jgi:hypothetical protein
VQNKTGGSAIKSYLCGMTNELIAKFVEGNVIPTTKSVMIEFKKRQAINGLIVRSNDYEDLKSKNFWRIVPFALIEEWTNSKNVNIAKIFNGTEFTKLSVVTNK